MWLQRCRSTAVLAYTIHLFVPYLSRIFDSSRAVKLPQESKYGNNAFNDPAKWIQVVLQVIVGLFQPDENLAIIIRECSLVDVVFPIA